MAHTHRYAVACSWSGSTGVGYEGYRREHHASVAGADLSLSSDPAFRGDPNLMNPELLLVLAASSCQLLAFLAVAARARLDVVEYVDEALGEMPAEPAPAWVTRIVLRPRITVCGSVSEERIRHLVAVAHHECYIANSLKTEVAVEPTIVLRPSHPA